MPRFVVPVRWLVYVAVACMVVRNVADLWVLMPRPAPLRPWDAQLVVDAYRATQGMPVYPPPHEQRAAWMYGPLTIYAVAAWFSLWGPSNYAGRVITLVAALITVTLLAWVLTRRKPWANFFLAWGLLFSLHEPLSHYFADSRPDLLSMLLSLLSVLAFYTSYERRRWLGMALGIACLLAATLAKQTAAAFAFVPALVWLSDRGGCSRRHVAWVALPIVSVVAGAIVMRVGWPLVFDAMFIVPARYPVNVSLMAFHALVMLTLVPYFCIFFYDWLLDESASSATHSCVPWILASVAVAAPLGAAAAGKVGGWCNSYLPALFAMIAFCIVRFDRVLAVLDRPSIGYLKRLALAALFIPLLWAPFLNTPDRLSATPAGKETSCGDESYQEVIAQVAQLPGIVVCPDDPTIPLLAKGYAGRCLQVELDHSGDANGRLDELPPSVRRELAQARWVVKTNTIWNRNFTQERLERLGFHKVDLPGSISEVYSLWTRSR